MNSLIGDPAIKYNWHEHFVYEIVLELNKSISKHLQKGEGLIVENLGNPLPRMGVFRKLSCLLRLRTCIYLRFCFAILLPQCCPLYGYYYKDTKNNIIIKRMQK